MKVVYCLAVLAVLVALVAGQRLETVTKQLATNGITYYSISLEDIFTDIRVAGVPAWGPPLPAADASPQSDRVLNLQWVPPAAAVTASGNAAVANVANLWNEANRFVLGFRGFTDAQRTAAETIQVKFEAPYLEVDPASCTAAGASQNCRCNPDSASLVVGQEVNPYLPEADKIVFSGTVPAAGNDVVVTPNTLSTYFEHAPFVGQNPFARTYRRLCYRIGTTANTWIDTRVLVAVTQGCLDGTAAGTSDTTGMTLCAVKNNTFLTVIQNDAGLPRFIDPAVPAQNALRLSLGDFFVTDAAAPGGVRVPALSNVGASFGESGPMVFDRVARTTCCGASAAGIASPLESAAAITVARFGVCIDPSIASCCGRRAYTSTREKCCSRLTSRIRYVDQPCPCAFGGPISTQQAAGFCQYQGPNVIIGDDTAGATQGASSTTYNCCAQTRFPDLNTVVATSASGAVTTFTRFQRSFCVDSLGSDGYRCCSDGNVYDAGSQQCCEVTGVQTLNLPCPCGTSSDCPSGSGCCFQIFPPGLPRGQGASQCSRFANYPRSDNGGSDGGDLILSVPANPAFQRCPGTCYDLQYQMCCNGAVCESGFTRCCNDTCCNKFSQTCEFGQRSPASSLANTNDLGVYFEMCSSVELLSGRKAFFVFVLPAWLLLATAISLALVTVLARRATEHIFELTERAIVFLAVITVMLGCPFFFSPFYKNGIVIVLIGLVCILVAVARKRKASLALVILLVAAILYVINPFDGNIYLGITSAVPVYGARPESSLLEAAQNLWRTSENCIDFYDYFLYDPATRDQRLDNPEDFTFGYCSRGYITALIIFAIALYVVLLLLLLLAIFSLVKKLGIKAVEPIELEVAMEPEMVY